MFQFDLYSCSEFTPDQVLTHINEYFNLQTATWQFIDRNTDEFVLINSGKWMAK